MSFSVPPLAGAVAHDDAESLTGTLAPTGGTGPYRILAIWPAGAVADVAPDRVALHVWRDRDERFAATWQGPEIRPEFICK